MKTLIGRVRFPKKAPKKRATKPSEQDSEPDVIDEDEQDEVPVRRSRRLEQIGGGHRPGEQSV